MWIGRELFARVKTRAIQLGLEGDVISNEETVYFKPLDASGLPAPWQRTSFFLPVRSDRGEESPLEQGRVGTAGLLLLWLTASHFENDSENQIRPVVQ